LPLSQEKRPAAPAGAQCRFCSPIFAKLAQRAGPQNNGDAH